MTAPRLAALALWLAVCAGYAWAVLAPGDMMGAG